MSKTTTVIPVESDDAYAEQTSSIPSTALTVLYFHAPWAAPCAQMSTVLDTLASTYPVSSPPKIAFLSINAEELPDISEEHDVTAVPFIVLRRDGHTLDTISGSDVAKVRAAVEKHAGAGSNTKAAAQLPPVQEVTRPLQEPLPAAHAAALDPAQHKNNGSTTTATKNLSAYAPDATDASTAPEYSSNTTPGLGTKTENEGGSGEDLNTRLKELTNAAPCMLFMKGTPSAPQCGFSRQLVSILRENNVRYGFFNILADDEVRQGLKEYAEWPTFPQLWLGGELVGGLDIVKEELEADAGFFGQYAVDSSKKGIGGPATAEEQASPATAA